MTINVNWYLSKLDFVIEEVNTLHAQALLDRNNKAADGLAIVREELFWLYHSLGQEDL